MTSAEPSASSASAASPVLSVPSQHQYYHTQTRPASCGPLLALDTRYEESALRTPLHALPFPHPKWCVDPATGAVYEDASAILEACEPGLEDVRPSIENIEKDIVTKRKRDFQEKENEKSRSKKKERQE